MRNTDTAANGDRCPVDPAHGKMFMLPNGRQYCAVQAHDTRPRTPALYEHDGLTAVYRVPLAPKEDNLVAFRLPDSMKSALDPAPQAARPARVPTQAVPSQPPAAKAGVPFGGAGVVCRKPAGAVGNPCANCGRALVKSTVRKSGLEHSRN